MRICIIAEGSYPYVTGGVSSWIQMLINGMPEHEFVLFAIGAEEKNRGKFKYEIPVNLVEIIETFLDTKVTERQSKKNIIIDEQEIQAIKDVLLGNKTDIKSIISLLSKGYSISEILLSEGFYKLTEEVSKERYKNTSFLDFCWTLRSIFLPFFNVINETLPKADIYHSVSTGYAGILGCIAKEKYTKPFLLTEHGIYTREREEEIIKATWMKGSFKDLWIDYFNSMSKTAYEYANSVITLFERNKEIQMEIGCAEEKIKIISNGVNIEGFLNIDKIKDDEKYFDIGIITRVVPIKDIKTLIFAYSIVKEVLENARLFIIGPVDEDEEYSLECINLVKTMNLLDVYFTGSVNIKDYIGKIDVLTLSSISEGQPLALLESMAAGKAFVSTDVGSCKELIHGFGDDFGPAGIVVPVMDYEEMAKALIKLAKDKKLRDDMGRNGFKRINTNYTIDRFIDSYKSLYRELEVN